MQYLPAKLLYLFAQLLALPECPLDCPWHGSPVNPTQDIPTEDPSNPNCTSCDPWHNFTMSTAPIICRSYTSRGIRVLWNTAPPRLNILVNECPGSYIKAGMVSHGFSVNYEADNYETKGKICHTPGYHCRGESWPFCQHGYYKEAPLWATYSHLLWQLTFGVDLPGLSEVNLVNTSYSELYANVFNRYAGSIRPPTINWVGGIIALRDGLDSANTNRFPESKFGIANVKNKARLMAIAKAFASQGAREGDLHAATSAAMNSRKRNSTNDVGWRIWEGNYGNGAVSQLAPLETSVGRWAVGPKDQPYGRFARAFDSATGRTDISFVLDRRLWGGLPLKESNETGATVRVIRLAVIYLDGAGSFDIYFDTAAGCNGSRKRSIIGTNTYRWRTTAFDIVDGVFDRRCRSKGGAADIVLRSTSTIDTVFQGLEIYDPAML